VAKKQVFCQLRTPERQLEMIRQSLSPQKRFSFIQSSYALFEKVLHI